MSTDQTLYTSGDIKPGVYIICDTCNHKIDTSKIGGSSGTQYVGLSHKEDKFGVVRATIKHVLAEGCEDAREIAKQQEEPTLC